MLYFSILLLLYLSFPTDQRLPVDERLLADEGLAFSSFRKVTEGEVRSHVMASAKKYCALGAMCLRLWLLIV